MPSIKPVSDLRNYGEVLRDVAVGQPVFLTRNGHGRYAVLDMEEYRKEMAGVYTTSVNRSTLDEAPMAYKSLEDIIDVIGESVDVIEVLKPIYNFKAN